MRVLVAGRNAKLLAANAGAFADDLTIETAATKAACFALLERTEFDLIIACETLSDGSGLEVLSHAAVNTPNSLRIFAARPSTLNLLKGELGLFGLFRTLPYPISFRKLWAAMNLARSCGADTEPQTAAQTPGALPAQRVGNAAVATAASNGRAINRGGAIAPQAVSPSEHVEVRQVVRARPGTMVQRVSASSTAVATARNTAATNSSTVVGAAGSARQAQTRQSAQARATPTTQRTANAAVAPARTGAAANSSTVAHAAGSARQAQPRQPAQARSTPTAQRTISNAAVVATVRTGAAANSNTAAHAAGPSRQAQPRQVAQARATPTVQRAANAGVATGASRRAAATARQDARIPQTQAFKRALAKRNAAKLDANSNISAVDVLGEIQQARESGGRGGRRREPAMSNDSLAQLARLTTTRRPTYYARGVSGGKKRAAIFVGSGVFAAVTAAVLTFFMLNANNSIGRSPLPLVASIDRPVSHKVFPWQAGPTPQQPASTLPVRSEVAASAAADLEVQAEAESDASAVEPGHPGPPPPNPPPAPYEPPSADAPGWVDE